MADVLCRCCIYNLTSILPHQLFSARGASYRADSISTPVNIQRQQRVPHLALEPQAKQLSSFSYSDPTPNYDPNPHTHPDPISLFLILILTQGVTRGCHSTSSTCQFLPLSWSTFNDNSTCHFSP